MENLMECLGIGLFLFALLCFRIERRKKAKNKTETNDARQLLVKYFLGG